MENSEPNRGRKRRERGSQMVEMSLVIVPFFALILLIMDIAMAVFCKASLQYAVREGVRYAITGQTLSGKGQDASIQTVIEQNSMGFLQGASGASLISIQYYTPDTLTPTASNAGGNIVEISVQGYTYTPLVPLLRSANPIPFTARSADRMEPSPGGVPPKR
jgi:Flp pilus assembly protein TadG